MSESRCAVRVRGDEVTIEVDHLAGKLGLATEALRSEMRRGIVYGVAEQGIGADAGRTRLTFRYRARSWTVVVEPDGTLQEVWGR
jgi:predicted ArsR family transcriptional regulator